MSRTHIEIENIEDRVIEMANLAQQMLQHGVEALTNLNLEMANSVVAKADSLANFDEEIETHILKTLALQAPVAGDLRRVGASLKMITYINRVGRYGYDIARIARDWPEEKPHVARMVNLQAMGEKVQAMLGIVLQSYQKSAAPDHERLIAIEEDVDAMRYAVWRECLTYMAEDSKNIEPCANYMMVARYLERCGDNICKMAEKLHYAATGHRLLIK